MQLYVKYGNDQIYTRSSASYMPHYFNSYEISWSVLRFFAKIVFIASLDNIQEIDCASNKAMIKVQPIAEWWVSKLCISQSSKMGPSFVQPCCVCTLTWQLSAQSSHGTPSYIVHTNFQMHSAMITFAPKQHCLANLVIVFSLTFGHTDPGYSMPSPANSAKHVGIKTTAHLNPGFFSHAPPIILSSLMKSR